MKVIFYNFSLSTLEKKLEAICIPRHPVWNNWGYKKVQEYIDTKLNTCGKKVQVCEDRCDRPKYITDVVGNRDSELHQVQNTYSDLFVFSSSYLI